MAEEKVLSSPEAYEIRVWKDRLGAIPIKTIAMEDFSESYEMTRARVLKLENGKYALVTESGCSCYESEDAEIDVQPNKKAAMALFDKWVSENKR